MAADPFDELPRRDRLGQGEKSPRRLSFNLRNPEARVRGLIEELLETADRAIADPTLAKGDRRLLVPQRKSLRENSERLFETLRSLGSGEADDLALGRVATLEYLFRVVAAAYWIGDRSTVSESAIRSAKPILEAEKARYMRSRRGLKEPDLKSRKGIMGAVMAESAGQAPKVIHARVNQALADQNYSPCSISTIYRHLEKIRP
jgi:hypothetical protein